MKKRSLFLAIMVSFFSLALYTNVSAETNNDSAKIDLRCRTLTDDIILSDGSCISAGSEEISININNNYGYIASEFKIELFGADTIVDQNGKIIINSSAGSIASAAQDENTIYIASVSTELSVDVETVLTVYTNKKPKNIELSNYNIYGSYEDILSEMPVNENQSTPMFRNAYVFHTTIGDANGDGNVGIADATIAVNAVTNASNLGLTYQLPSGEVCVTTSNFDQYITTLLSSYNITFLDYSTRVIVCAASFDGNKDHKVSMNDDYSDAQQILEYYVANLTNNPYNTPGWYIGDTIPIIVNN